MSEQANGSGKVNGALADCWAIEHAFAGPGQIGGGREPISNQGEAYLRGHLLDLSGFSVYVTPPIDHPGRPDRLEVIS